MNNQVVVATHPKTGLVITQSENNPSYGTIRLDAMTTSMEGGFLNKRRKSAFIRGKMEDLESLGLKAGQVLPGIIQRQESYQPFYEGQKPKMNPESGEVILQDGREIFFQDIYTQDVNAPLNVFIEEQVKSSVDAGQII